MKIVNVKPIGKKKVYDLSVKDTEHYILENGVVTHNTGPMYSANNVIIVGRQQDKDGKEVVGYHFILNVEKSRFVRDKKKIDLHVTFDGGIDPYSGLLTLGQDLGFIIKPKNGKYSRATFANIETGEFEYEEEMTSEKKTNTATFWKPLFQMEEFHEAIRLHYQLGANEYDESTDEMLDLYELEVKKTSERASLDDFEDDADAVLDSLTDDAPTDDEPTGD